MHQFPHYVVKVEKKGRTKEELHRVIEWLTAFDDTKIQELIDDKVTFADFFQQVTMNPAFENEEKIVEDN